MYVGKIVEWHKNNKSGKGEVIQINFRRGTTTGFLVKDLDTKEIIKIKEYAYPKEWVWG